MNYFIITGSSRGIGEALVRKLLVPGNVLFGAARTMNENLSEMAQALHIPYYFYETDLADTLNAIGFINDVFAKIIINPDDKIALINNAGKLDPVYPINQMNPVELENHMKLNLLTPMMLSSVFISKTQQLHNTKVILNISSGASTFPYKGWSAYCASKSGVDMFTKVAGLEQDSVAYPTKIFALAPGIIETTMQAQIRSESINNFPAKNDFIRLYEEGKLLKPDFVAQIVTTVLFSSKISNGSIMTINQLVEIAGL